MEFTKQFARTRFTSRVINEAIDTLAALDGEREEADRLRGLSDESYTYSPTPVEYALSFGIMSVSNGGETWTYDDIHEWYEAYDRPSPEALLYYKSPWFQLTINVHPSGTSVSVTAPTNASIQKIMRRFNLAEPESIEPKKVTPTLPPKPVSVFIGHGRNQDWREIKDHLQDKHQYRVVAFEVGARSGHSIRRILENMLSSSSFALLIMTGEDNTTEGDARARQNVVHELGLFQGKLGFDRAIAVVEEGVEVFTNLDGVQQIRYDRGNVETTYGEILATLRREFGDRR